MNSEAVNYVMKYGTNRSGKLTFEVTLHRPIAGRCELTTTK